MNLKKKQFVVYTKGSKFSIIQHRITQATYKKQPRKIRNLQRLLIKNLSTRIQTILIASQIKNRHSFFLDTVKRKSNNFSLFFEEKKRKKQNSLFFFFEKKKNKAYIFFSSKKRNRQVLEKKYLYSINADFVKKFSLIFYKKFFYYFLFFLSIFFFKEKKKRKKKKKKKINERPLSDSSLHISSNPLFLLICNLVFSPVIETLLQKKKEKIFRNSSEVIMFLKNLSNPSTELIQNSDLARLFFLVFFSSFGKREGNREGLSLFFEKKKEPSGFVKREIKKIDKNKEFLKEKEKQEATEDQLYQNLDLYINNRDKKKLISTWILKLEIKGFYDHSNNSWLYENFPIESMRLKPLLKLMLNLYLFFEKKQTGASPNKKPKHLTQSIKTFSAFFPLKKKQRKKFFKNKSQLFHKDFFPIWNNLNSKKTFFDNFCTNFDNFFNFCLIGLENYLKKIFYIFNDFYFSEWHSQFIFDNELMPTKHVFYFPRFIYLTGQTPRQFKKIKKFINLFLKHRGLYFKNFTYFNLKKGVDLLGWNLKTKEKDLIVKVSESFCNFQKKEIKWLIKNSNQEPIHKLIVKLNNKIKNDLIEYENQRLYNILNFKNIETLYNDLNFFINQIFWKWAKKKHNNRSNIWIFQKYWGFFPKPVNPQGLEGVFFPKPEGFFFSKKKRYKSVFSKKKKRNKQIQKEIIKNKRRIFVLLYSNESWKKLYDNFFLQNKNLLKIKHFDKKEDISSSFPFFLLRKNKEKKEKRGFFFLKKKKRKNYFHLEYNLFNKYQNNLYFLNFYSLDFQTQYYFYIFSLP